MDGIRMTFAVEEVEVVSHKCCLFTARKGGSRGRVGEWLYPFRLLSNLLLLTLEHFRSRLRKETGSQNTANSRLAATARETPLERRFESLLCLYPHRMLSRPL